MSDRERFESSLIDLLRPFPTPDPQQLGRLFAHYELLLRWNRTMNLTTVTKLEEIVARHYCESLFAASHLGSGAMSVGDIGSGAGFPGIPIGIVCPEARVTLVESHKRKAVFLREATRGLPQFSVVPTRASELKGSFEWVVSRAVKWTDFRKDALRVAARVMLLATRSDQKEIEGEGGVKWLAPVGIPWGEDRILLIGDVPRGT
jgi:16S rRNA (guanine527-N7)-methyltransferase